MARKSNIYVKVGKDEPIEKALRRFKRMCEKMGIKKEVKARRYYEKPSETRRKELRKAERNRRKTGRKDKDPKFQKRGDNQSWMFTHPKLTEAEK